MENHMELNEKREAGLDEHVSDEAQGPQNSHFMAKAPLPHPCVIDSRDQNGGVSGQDVFSPVSIAQSHVACGQKCTKQTRSRAMMQPPC